MQREGEWFEARYDPATRMSPDERPRQLDGLGWALWAFERVDAFIPGAGARRAELVRRSLDVIRASLHQRTWLPQPSSDYWERRERHLSLGTAGPILVGLCAAERLGRRGAVPDVEGPAITLADSLEAAVVEHFGPRRLTACRRRASRLDGLPRGDGSATPPGEDLRTRQNRASTEAVMRRSGASRAKIRRTSRGTRVAGVP